MKRLKSERLTHGKFHTIYDILRNPIIKCQEKTVDLTMAMAYGHYMLTLKKYNREIP